MSVPVKILSGGSFPRIIAQFEKDFILHGLHKIGTNGNAIPVLDDDGSEALCYVEKDDLLNQIDSLVIIGKCQCGDPECHTVQFQHYRAGLSHKIIETELEDGRIMRIFVNRERGLLSGLEIVRE